MDVLHSCKSWEDQGKCMIAEQWTASLTQAEKQMVTNAIISFRGQPGH